MGQLDASIHLDTIQIYEIAMTAEFVDWLGGLPDPAVKLRVVARLRRAMAGNFGDWTQLDGALAEMRLRFGPGYRLYFTRTGRTLIVMLAGGDKSSQQRDIERAKRLMQEL